MSNIFTALFKQEIRDRSMELTISRLSRVSEGEQVDTDVYTIKFTRIPVKLIIFRLPDDVDTYNLLIKSIRFDNRSPYFNGETDLTKMSLDRVLFYIRYYMEF